MQIVNCSVHLSGDLRNTVHKRGVTVAEIVVLRNIHGGDAVTSIQPVKNDRRSHALELDRLRSIYNRRDQVVDQLFPGANPKLPTNLKDIGVDHNGATVEEPEEEEAQARDSAAQE
jgi:hypothetical protein